MSDVKWIKIYTNMMNNKKIKRIRKMPEGNNIILIWVFLLTAAGESNKNGGLFLTDTIPFKEEDLAIEFDFEISVIKFALITLEKFEMIEIYESVIYIKNWSEYQNIDGLDKVREQSRLRMQKHRENIKLLRNGYATVTQSYGTELDIELDKEKEINIAEKTILHELNAIQGYPFDYKKDLEYIQTLTVDFPNRNLLENIKAWKVWLLDHPLTKSSNPRSQIRNWLKPKKWDKQEVITVQVEPEIPEDKLKYMEMKPVD